MEVRIASLHVYPIKGCAGSDLSDARLDSQGIENDRRWMLVREENGVFLSQREFPTMARLLPLVLPHTLTVTASEMPPLAVPLLSEDALTATPATVWRDTHEVRDEGNDAAAWFSAFLGVACRLVRTPKNYARRVNPQNARPSDRVGFADGYPLLLTSVASLADLNTRLDVSLPMDRFRPNLVVEGEGLTPFAEDHWKTLHVPASGIGFRVASSCARCAVTTVDQKTGQATGPEPLRTLAAFRRDADGKVMFGRNLIHDWHGNSSEPQTLRVGDTILING